MPKLGIHAGYSALTGNPLVLLSWRGSMLMPVLSGRPAHASVMVEHSAGACASIMALTTFDPDSGLPRIVKGMLEWGRTGQVSVAQTLQLSQRRQIINRRADHDKTLRKKRQYAAVGELTLPSSSC